jgi:hypothetical protein
MVGAHCQHHNQHSIGICYEGGLDIRGASFISTVRFLKIYTPNSEILNN